MNNVAKNEVLDFNSTTNILPMRMIGLCKSETIYLVFFNISSEICDSNTND